MSLFKIHFDARTVHNDFTANRLEEHVYIIRIERIEFQVDYIIGRVVQLTGGI